MNMNRKLVKIDMILQPWRAKYLFTEALINSSVISQFTHLVMVLPTPDDSFFKSHEQNIFHFIWDAKPDKIKSAYLYKIGWVEIIRYKITTPLAKSFTYSKVLLQP